MSVKDGSDVLSREDGERKRERLGKRLGRGGASRRRPAIEARRRTASNGLEVLRRKGGVVRKKRARDPVSEHDLMMMMMELLRGSDPRGSIGEVRYGELGMGCTADYGSASGCARLQEETRSKKGPGGVRWKKRLH